MTLSEYIDSIKSKSIAVIGIGVSNTPLIELLAENGCKVTACDRRDIDALEGEGEKLLSMGVKLRLGEDYLENLDEDIIFRTPGLMPFDPHLEAAKARGSVISSEMELFFALCPCKIIAVTGSDGKTTTTTIISELLKAAGKRVHLGGNIGHPLLCETPDIRPEDFAVLELSSFQLHSMSCRPDIALITNVAPNHLDKHKDFQDYIDAKSAIFTRQRPEDKLILNLDDEHTEYYRSLAHSDIYYFTDKKCIKNGSCCIDGELFRFGRPLMREDEIKLPGKHNVQNYLAAFTAVEGLVSDELCRKVAMSFAGVEHRLELVRELRGVRYINDSIGTSPTRTAAGLHALKTKPIVIAGGYDKHIPFDGLGNELCLYSKRVYLTGDTAEKIRDSIMLSKYYQPGAPELYLIDDFTEAVLAAAASAEEGDTVLLSPACAAFDKFKNFAQRGEYFKKIIMELK